MTPPPDAAALAAGAREAVREAGRIAMARFGREGGRSWEKAPGQVVTDADLAIDAFLKRELGALDPSAAWLSEETEDDRARLGAGRVWVVDPIDGTRSFAEGLPEFTVCVALLERDRPVLGLVLAPATGELYEARAGSGATLDGRPLRVGAQGTVAGARIAAGRYERRRHALAGLLEGAELVRVGSLALKLCLVAAGRFDAYVTFRRSHDWDIAAAAVILAEAGALLTDAEGAPVRLNRPDPRHPGLVAANPALHRAILAAADAPARGEGP